ncbi:hypothetical protein [Leptospira ryugenii]|nr:hypothetical protein [Leptospira ryugenii]
METFTYSYAVLEVKATLDEKTLKLKQGLRNYELNLHEILYFYFGPMPSGQFDELVILTQSQNGKQKTYRFNCTSSEVGMQNLVARLAEKKPSADLRNVPRSEAFQKLKTFDTSKVTLFAVPIVVSLVLSIFLAPMFVHGLDKGSKTIKANELTNPHLLGTRNLILQGSILSECLEEKTTRKGRTTTKFFCPLVDESWESGSPIHILAQIDDIPEEEFNALFERTEFKGVLRNVLWEGPSSSTKDFFEKEYGASFTEEVYQFEVDGDASLDLIIALAILGIALLILLGITFFMYKRSF